MLKAILLSSLMQAYGPADSHHDRFQGRLDLDRIAPIRFVRPVYDDTYQFITYEAELKRRREAERKRRVIERRRQATLKRMAAKGNLVMAGILSLKRLPETGPIDGCEKTQKGLIMQGGFMIFTCEKLLPDQPINRHEPAFQNYGRALLTDGWRKLPESTKIEMIFTRNDGFGCKPELSLRLWTDRSMNEPSKPADTREAHRQIVFTTKFRGQACDRYYPIAEALTAAE